MDPLQPPQVPHLLPLPSGETAHTTQAALWEGTLLSGGDGGIPFPAADRPNMTILIHQDSEQGGLSAFHKIVHNIFVKSKYAFIYFFLGGN